MKKMGEVPVSVRQSLWRTALVFVVVVVALQWLWGQARGTAIEHGVIDGATVGTAVFLINAWTPGVQAQAAGPRIKAPGGGINILNGCEGTEVLFLFIAALAAYRFTWATRLVGLLGGTVFVFAANQLRLLVLFYSYRSERSLFDQLHGLVLPLLLIVATVALFALLMRLDDRVRRAGLTRVAV